MQTAGANPVSAAARLGMLPRKLKRRNAAEQAEQACPVSNALRGNMDIQLNASLA
jgi:organic hydroperoxide reductase OsmC/OhrA